VDRGTEEDIVMKPPASRQFPPDFAWGTATASHQIEGALDADGRGKTIWDTFADDPAHIVDQSRPDVACQSYTRYGEDAALIADAHMKHYRFSIAWSRIQPNGSGPANEKGVDYYARLADALLERGVTPWATCFHWDLPQALEDKGGWRNRDTCARFAEYNAIVGDRLGDRVKHFIALNEASVFTYLGHSTGIHAPGLKDRDAIGPVIHHLNLGQGLALNALRERVKGAVLGTTLAVQPVRPHDRLPENQPAATLFDAMWNRAFLDPPLLGSYPEALAPILGDVVKDGDLAIARQKVDFVGVNYYSPLYVRAHPKEAAGVRMGGPPEGVPLDAFGREIDPSGLYEMLVRIKNEYGDPLLYITENGCSDPFSPDPAIIDDRFRIDFLREHLAAVLSAREAGARVAGYFHWSLVDNWEWALGFTSKFGLVAMNRETGERTKKASYAWYARLAQTGQLDAG
jgi:beta-glucosidase